ncbi:MAG TPA: GH1 family beta-glucosidase [Streptosporangiaceae bacterium]|nr:GH1 family beta-glucosidase [Streptosporangiaceae bacterium]
MTSSASDGLPASTSFPAGFTWGAATAAYQIEGGASADGRGQSIWDTFSRVPGNVRGGDTGDIACDAYHRYAEDVELMSSLGLTAYRFSISWPRVQPGGRGPLNAKGLDYYRALLDRLAERGIRSAATLYHWDLPQELQDEGGWAARATAERFADYAAAMAQTLGDRVWSWITLNEPQVVANHGYREGNHAPGLKDPVAAATATHHLLLAHGLATSALRANLPAGVPVGITLDLHQVKVLADGPDEALEQARARTDANVNGLYLEPLLYGRYPAQASAELLPPDSAIASRDLEVASQPLGFLGVNYYSSVYLRSGDPDDLRQHEAKAKAGVPGVVEYRPPELERTAMDWLVDADGLYDLLMRLSKDAPGLPLYITENGRASEDYVNPEGAVHDPERVRYLHQHLSAAARAINDGANLAGYFAWSLLDNFEWGWGYQRRFGIVFVDFGTQRRIPKTSASFYAQAIRANAVPPLPADAVR